MTRCNKYSDLSGQKSGIIPHGKIPDEQIGLFNGILQPLQFQVKFFFMAELPVDA